MVILAVVPLKGWPNITESSYQAYIFVFAHPLASFAWVMSIYLTVLMTLERFHAIYLKGMTKKQGNQTRIKLTMVLVIIFAAAFTIPKSAEYTWKTSDVRTSYDLLDKKWLKVAFNSEQWTYSKRAAVSSRILTRLA